MARIKKKAEDDLSSFGGRFRYSRITAGFSNQGKLAKALGLSQQTISYWESGLIKNPHHLPKAADLMGVSYDWLKDGTGEMKGRNAIRFEKLKKLPPEGTALFETAFGDSLDSFIKKFFPEF